MDVDKPEKNIEAKGPKIESISYSENRSNEKKIPFQVYCQFFILVTKNTELHINMSGPTRRTR